MSRLSLLGKSICIAALLVGFASPGFAVSYVYVGSWSLGDGPHYATNPAVYTGQEAAAFLFGGNASDYAISTISNDPNLINFSTWLDGWADGWTYASSGSPAAHNFKFDSGAPGYADGPAYSAYVSDHFSPGSSFVNYAFKVVPDASVPDDGATAALLVGAMVAGATLRRRLRK